MQLTAFWAPFRGAGAFVLYSFGLLSEVLGLLFYLFLVVYFVYFLTSQNKLRFSNIIVRYILYCWAPVRDFGP